MIKLIEEVHRWNSSVGNEITTVHCRYNDIHNISFSLSAYYLTKAIHRKDSMLSIGRYLQNRICVKRFFSIQCSKEIMEQDYFFHEKFG